MNPERLVAALDIGSAKTTAIIAEVEGDLPKHPTLKVLGVGKGEVEKRFVPLALHELGIRATVPDRLADAP